MNINLWLGMLDNDYRENFYFEISGPAAGELAADIRSLLARTEWQPIETAPKHDGMPIIVYGSSEYHKTNEYVYLAHWEDCRNCWVFEGEDMYPTHWMNLPEPPKQEAK